jgi:hypothetical protein
MGNLRQRIQFGFERYSGRGNAVSNRAAGDIASGSINPAQQTTQTPPQNQVNPSSQVSERSRPDLTESLVALRVGENEVRANARVVDTADEVLGNPDRYPRLSRLTPAARMRPAAGQEGAHADRQQPATFHSRAVRQYGKAAVARSFP